MNICPHCGFNSIVYDRWSECFKCFLCDRPLTKLDTSKLIAERNEKYEKAYKRPAVPGGGYPRRKQRYGNRMVRE